VDLDYPEDLHEKHSDFPLAPEKVKITSDMIFLIPEEIGEKLGMNAF